HSLSREFDNSVDGSLSGRPKALSRSRLYSALRIALAAEFAEMRPTRNSFSGLGFSLWTPVAQLATHHCQPRIGHAACLASPPQFTRFGDSPGSLQSF